MAESDKIKHSDIIEDDIFGPSSKSASEFLGFLKQIDSGIKAIAATSGKKIQLIDIKSVEDVERLTEEVKKVDDATQAYNETQKRIATAEKELIRLQKEEALTLEKLNIKKQEQRKFNKQLAQEELNLIGAYKRASQQLIELRIRYKDLAIQNKANTQEGRALLAQITALDVKLKEVDATVGQHQRNVGNYTGSILNASKGLKGFGEILNRIGALLGFNTFYFEQLVGVGQGLVKTTKDLKDVQKAASVTSSAAGAASKVQSEEIKKLTVSQRIYNSVVGNSTGALKAFRIALAATGILVIITLLYMAADAMGVFKSETEDTTESIEEQNRALEEQKKKLEDLAAFGRDKKTATEIAKAFTGGGETAKISTLELQDALTELQTTADKFTLDKAKFAYENFANGVFKTADQLNDEKQNPINVLTAEEQSLIQSIAGGTLADFTKAYANQNSELLKAIQLIEAEIDKRDALSSKKKRDIKDTYDEIASLKKLIAELDELQIQMIEDDEAREKAAAEFAAQQRIKDLQLVIDSEKSILAEKQVAADLQVKVKEKLAQDLLDIEDKYYKKLVDQIEQQVDDQAKIDADFNQERTDKIRQQIEDEYALKLLQLRKNEKALYEERRKQLIEIANAEILDNQTNAAKVLLIQEQLKKDLEDLDREYNEKRLNNIIDFEEKISDAFFEGLQKRRDKQEEILNQQLDTIDKNIKQQQDLANRGLANTLAFQEAERAKALEKQAQLEKQRQQQEEAQDLADIFLEFMKAFAADGNTNAAQKALAQTLIAKGISKAIAGSFAEGVEDFKGKGTGTSDSNLIRFSNHESVVTAEGTSETPGLVTAVNKNGYDGAVDWAWKNIYMPQFNSSVPSMVLDNSSVVNKLDSLEKTIKNKKEVSFDVNVMNQIVKNEIENGIRRVKTYEKRRF